MERRDHMLVTLNASTKASWHNMTATLLLRPWLYLYSEVEHQAVWVSLCQLVEEISPCGVCNHLLQPSWSLKNTSHHIGLPHWSFILPYVTKNDAQDLCSKSSPLPQQWKWNQLSEGQSVLSGDSWGDFPLAPGPEQALHLQSDKDRLLSSSGSGRWFLAQLHERWFQKIEARPLLLFYVRTHLDEPLGQQIDGLSHGWVVFREKLNDVFWRTTCLEIPAREPSSLSSNF